MSRALAVLLFALAALSASSSRRAAGADPVKDLDRRVGRVEALLREWQFDQARELAERLLLAHPDLPAVQFAAGWVKFHLGEHRAAASLVERAAAAFSGKLDRDERVGMVRAMARITEGFVRRASADGRVAVWHAPGVDEVLVPDLIDTVRRTLDVVGEDLGHRPGHEIVVQVLPDSGALADATGLTADEIRTSGTIAVCKFGRLMVISPRTILKGYSYLDTASHELVHLIISQKTRNKTPIWLHEALAKYEDTRWRAEEPLFREGLSPMRQTNLARALAAGELITFEQMHPSMALLPSQEAADLAFSEVYTVTGFFLSRKGYAGIRQVLDLLRQGTGDMEAIERVYGLDRKHFVQAWLSWLRSQKLVRLGGVLDGLTRKTEKTGRGSEGERTLTRNRRVDLRDFFHLGQLLRARGKVRASLVEYDKARKRAGPQHAALWVIADKLGRVLSSLGRGEDAREAYRESLRIRPDGLEAHLHLGRLLIEDDPWLAFLHLREANRLNPIDPRTHRSLMSVCAKLAEQGDEREDFGALFKRHRAASKILRIFRPDRSGRVEPAASAGEDQGTTSLRIVTRPWARVWLDLVDTGLTTPVYRLPVSPGSHVVGLQAECLDEPEVILVRVEEGRTEVIDRDLCPRTGREAAQ